MKVSLNSQTAALVPYYIAFKDISMSAWFEDERGLKFIKIPKRVTGFRGRAYTISNVGIISWPKVKVQGKEVEFFGHLVC